MTSGGRRAGFQTAVFALIFVLVLLIGLFAMLILHRPPRVAKEMLPPKVTQPDADEAPLVKSATLEIHFYLDTTESMRGFLTQPEGRKNYFNEILDKALGILKEGWTEAHVHFWGFGQKDTAAANRAAAPVPIELRSFLGKPDAFTGTKTFIDTAIH